ATATLEDTDPTQALAFSADGKTLATGCRDGSLKLWDVFSRRVTRTHHLEKGWIRSVAFSPNGAMLATGSQYGMVKLWEVRTGTERKTLRGGTDWVDVAFAPDGKSVATGSWDGTGRP